MQIVMRILLSISYKFSKQFKLIVLWQFNEVQCVQFQKDKNLVGVGLFVALMLFLQHVMHDLQIKSNLLNQKKF